MNRVSKSLLAAAVAAGLCGSVGFVQAGSSNAQSIQRLDEEHWKHPHMHRAMASLHEARTQLEAAEDVFKGHRAEALDHVDRAIEQIEKGLKEQHDETAVSSELPGARPLEGARFEHMHRALDRLRDARTELDAADKVFAGHRDEAIDHIDKAIKQLEEGIRDAER